MTPKTRKRFGLATALLVLLALATYAYAHDSGRWGGKHDRHGLEGLTQEQMLQLDEIRLEYNEQILALEKELVSKRGAADAYASAVSADPEKLAAYREEVRSLERQMEEMESEARAEIWQVLPSDQRALWSDHDKFCSMGCDWWPRRQGTGRMGSWMEMSRPPAGDSSVPRACCW